VKAAMIKLLFITVCLININKSTSAGVDEAFRSSKIVDELIPKPPGAVLDVKFECGVTTLGNKFTPLQVRDRPQVSWKDAKENDFYTLIMTDVEGKEREWLHWLAANIPGKNIEKGEFLTAFFPSAPPKESGEHRYVFLLFKQPEKINLQGHEKISTFKMEGRDKFSTNNFVQKFKLGSPVAGNFYYASWDESCNELYKLVAENLKKN
jgi:phosphatidylethanolamine-binding protein (PEBP) family uncharacterized protein